jgi:hypothetical protein
LLAEVFGAEDSEDFIVRLGAARQPNTLGAMLAVLAANRTSRFAMPARERIGITAVTAGQPCGCIERRLANRAGRVGPKVRPARRWSRRTCTAIDSFLFDGPDKIRRLILGRK